MPSLVPSDFRKFGRASGARNVERDFIDDSPNLSQLIDIAPGVIDREVLLQTLAFTVFAFAKT